MLPTAARENTNNVNNVTRNYIKPPPKPDDERYKAELEEVQNKINIINDKINNTSDNGPESNKREELLAQLDKLRGKQAEIRKNRSNTFEQLKSKNESLQKKKRDLKQSKDNLGYKTVKEIDNEIGNLERKIESGTLSILDEKKVVANISKLEKSKKTVKQFEIQRNAIDEDQKAIDELKKTLDDSDFKKNNEEYENVKLQLDAINKDYASDRAKRNELYDEKKKLMAHKREIQEQYNKAKQEFKKHQDEEYKRYQELRRKQAEERENQHKKEIAAKKREDAAVPAFQLDILNCENLINYFQSLNGVGKPAQQQSPSTTPIDPIDSNIRQPDATSNVPEGAVLMKKSDRSDDYFVGGSKKQHNKKKEKKSNKNNGVQLSLSIMEQLTSLNVAVPLNPSEFEKIVEDLVQKRKYFIENQDRVTKENIEKVEAEIAAMEESSRHNKKKINKKDQSNDKNESDSAIVVTSKEEEKAEDTIAVENGEEDATTATVEEKTEASW